MPPFACYPFIISPSFSHLCLPLYFHPPIFLSCFLSLSFSVSCVVGQVQRAMLTACPFSLAAGRTVTPVIQAYEHSVENACVCVSVCVLRRLWQCGGRGALLALPETAECADSRTHIEFGANDLSMMGVSQPKPGRADPSGSKTLNQMTLRCCTGRRVCKCVMCPHITTHCTHLHRGIKHGHSREQNKVKHAGNKVYHPWLSHWWIKQSNY